jgi:hypothetical protein
MYNLKSFKTENLRNVEFYENFKYLHIKNFECGIFNNDLFEKGGREMSCDYFI